MTPPPDGSDPLTPAMARAVGRLRFDPAAKRAFEGMSGGFMWSDEFSDDLDDAVGAAPEDARDVFRYLLAYRADVIAGEPTPRFADLWAAVERHHPSWPGFLPERRAHGLRDDLEREAIAFLDEMATTFDDLGLAPREPER